jgi:sugar phosphate isomerase/epimerase
VHARAQDAGVTVRSYHLFQRLHPLYSGYARRTAEALDLMRGAMETARANGVRTLIWHGAARDELRGPDTWNRFLPMVTEVGAMAAAAGVTVAIENVSWCIVSSVRDVQRLAKAMPDLAPADALGFTFDSFQALESGANPFMVLAAMGEQLRHVHISDGAAGDEQMRHQLPGRGEIPWPSLIRAIASAYNGPMMLEAPVRSAADIAATRAFLDPLIARTQEAPGGQPESLPPGLIEGIRLFNAGEYYECHEVIEHEWHAEKRPIRRLYQGILQIGVGLHHARGGNHRGAVLLLTDGIAKVSDFLPAALGLDLTTLVMQAQACLDEVQRLGPDGLGDFDWGLAPVIALPGTVPGEAA